MRSAPRRFIGNTLNDASLSVRRSAGKLDHLCPAVDLTPKITAVVLWTADEYFATKVGKTPLHRRPYQHCIDVFVELIDDFTRRATRRRDSVERIGFVSRHEFVHCRQIWKCRRTAFGGYRERADLAGPDVCDC